MGHSSKRFFLVICLSLSSVLALVLVALGYMAPTLRIVFATYQFFLIGICVGALTLATLGLIVERSQWNHYRIYFFTVMMSIFLLVVINCVIFRVLGGETLLRKLVWHFFVVFNCG